MKTNVLVLGRGYLGKEFERHGFEVWGREKLEYKDGILNVKDSLDRFSAIVNCIGKSNTRWCEDPNNWEETLRINTKLPKILSNACNNMGKKFVQISTGCLYDTSEELNTEESFTASHCRYTLSKWAGECNCNPAKDIILRPRLYFSDIPDKNNLLTKLPKFSNYIYTTLDSFTATSTIVGATKELIMAEQSGIFNVVQEGVASIGHVALWCNLPIKPEITPERLRKEQGLYLVNSILDISKLKQFYRPCDIKTSIQITYEELK